MPQRPSHILEVHSLAVTIVLTLLHHTALPDFRNCCIFIQQMHAELYVSRKFLSTTSRGIFTHFQPFHFEWNSAKQKWNILVLGLLLTDCCDGPYLCKKSLLSNNARWGVVEWIEHPLLMLEVRGSNPGHYCHIACKGEGGQKGRKTCVRTK